MDNNDNKKLEEIAAKINDGELDLSITEQFDSQDADKILQALHKINRVAQSIRQQGEMPHVKPGDKWADLRIKQKIGHGGIGEVYRAFDANLNCEVAVKFLNQKSQLYVSTEQFLQEARLMAKVRHPHVLAIHGATIDKDIAGYWSDYLDGDTLAKCLEQHPLNWQQQLTIAQELAAAVLQIHKNNIVHGDIKPQNVMLQAHRGAILLDFGSSRVQQLDKATEKIQQASPMAMAPEQFAGQDATPSSDIFSLGLLFWNLATGKHPLDGQTLAEIQQQTQQLQQQKHLLGGNKGFKKLTLQMLASKPENRPTIQTVVATLQQIQQKPAKRAKTIAFVSLLALAFGIAGISTYSNHKTKQANQETKAINTVLLDILLKSSPLEKGKDVLLIDVLDDAEHALFANEAISSQQKVFYLTQLVKTYRRQGKDKKSIALANKILALPSLSESIKLDLLMQKSAALNENKNYQQAEELLLQAIQIQPQNKHDVDVLVSALITLIHTYNESYQLEKVPSLLKQAKSIVKNGTGKKAYQANLALIEGNYWEIMDDIPKAFEFYQQAVAGFIQHYGEKNLDVLIAKGAAATVLTYRDESRAKGVQMLEKVVAEMTDFLGKEHSSTLIARLNLADGYAQLKQPQKALDTIVPFMPDVYTAYGKDGGMTLVFQNMLASFYQQAGNNQKAEQIMLEIIAKNNKKHGRKASQTLDAKLSYVFFLQNNKDWAKAQVLLNEITATAQTELGHEARLTLDIQETLLWNMYQQGDKISIISMQELLAKKIKLFGEQDPSVTSVQKHLQQMQQSPQK